MKARMFNGTPRKFYEKDKLCRAKVQQSAGPYEFTLILNKNIGAPKIGGSSDGEDARKETY